MNSSFTIIEAQKALQKYWNYPNFRPKQQEVLELLSSGLSVVALLPTGGGKSMCFQIPALLLDGVTIVVSPLISLMEDQVAALKSRGIKAEAIHSGHLSTNIDRILDNCIYGKIKLLYVSPERLHHPIFIERIKQMTVPLVAIDEAHCVSQWGHDFRPSYMKIKEFIEIVRPKQMIALTATANGRVIDELKSSLFIDEPSVVKGSFIRDNLSISIVKTEDKIGSIVKTSLDQKKTIIYVRSRRKVRMIAETLSNHGVKAEFFHAGRTYKEKKDIQTRFKNDKLTTVVATNAFGMGIDVSNVRRIIHGDIPPSIEEYYQEIGRAGRDGQLSDTLLFISKDDIVYSQKQFENEFPPFDFAMKVYKAIHVYFNVGVSEGEGMTKPLNYRKISDRLGLSVKQLIANVKLWQKLGAWEVSYDSRDRTYCQVISSPKEARRIEFRLPILKEVLDLLMRNYEQVFSNWIKVDIKKDAAKFKMSMNDYKELLQILKDKGVLKLFTLKAGSKITFLRNRQSNKYLDEYDKKYVFLKTLAQQRNKSVHQFLQTTECRMQFVLRYFDEKVELSCGKCDSCMTESLSQKDPLLKQREINEQPNFNNKGGMV